MNNYRLDESTIDGYCLSCAHCVYKDAGEFFCFLRGKPITLNYRPTVYFNSENCKDWVDEHKRLELNAKPQKKIKIKKYCQNS